MKRYFVVVLMVLVLLSGGGCSRGLTGGRNDRVDLKVIIAGSLLVPFQAVEKEYERLNPDVDVQLEGHGSVQVIRAVTELGEIADIVAVADAQLIPLMMYPLMITDQKKPYADWTIRFSANRLGLAYKSESAYSGDINDDNWCEVLARPDVTIGLADPRIDAMGYRTLMALQLAEDLYDDEGIFERTIGYAMDPAVKITRSNEVDTISVPEILKSRDPRIKLRGYSIQLMALLESGDLDYSFEYESVAKQRGLEWLRLPSAVDLSEGSLMEQYARTAVSLDFKRFSSIVPIFKGAPIVYGLTIPGNAMNPEEADRFINFLLGPEGQEIFLRTHHAMWLTPQCDNVEALSPSLQLMFPAGG